MELRHENVAWLLSTVQNDGNDVRVLGFFGNEFHKENLHFSGWKLGEWLNLMQVFIFLFFILLALPMYMCFLEWPSPLNV